jgi:tetratricopeptide (TPR) repeat protein
MTPTSDNFDNNSARTARFASGFTGGLAFLVYLYTLAPTVSGEDSGELIAAAYTLGIPHPAGYPIWTMLGFVFTKVIPFGDVAWRVNLMSAIFAAGTVSILAYTLHSIGIRRSVACAAALSFAFSREFWEQSVIAEVYTLNAFFTILCVCLLVIWSRSRSNAIIYVLTTIYGLSLSNHSSMYLLGPVFLVYVVALQPSILKQYRLLLICAGLFTIGLLVHLYLPIRSRANPPMDWGNPETFATFWEVFTRSQYHGIVTTDRFVVLFARQFLEFVLFIIWEFTPWVFVLSILGAAMLYKRNRPVLALTGALFAIVGLASLLVPNFPIEYHPIWMNTTYWIPCTLMLSFPIAFGLNNLFDAFPESRSFHAALLAVVIGSPLLIHFSHNNQSDNLLSMDYAQNQLNTMKENALYFGSGDYTVFPLTYLLIVEHQRHDVTIANQYGYISPEIFDGMPDDLRAQFGTPPAQSDEPHIFDWILSNTERPVYTTTPWPSSTRTPIQRGLLYEYLAEPSDAPPDEDIWSTYTWHSPIDQPNTRGDWTSELIHYEYRLKRGRDAFRAGDTEEATRLLHEAETFVHHDKQALHNIGLAYAQAGQLDEAVRVYTSALHDDPNFTPALFNLATALIKLNRYAEARPYVETLLRNTPDSPRFLRLQEKILQGQETLQD